MSKDSTDELDEILKQLLPVDIQVLGTPTGEPMEIDVNADNRLQTKQAIEAHYARREAEIELRAKLHATGYANDAFHDLPATDLEKWFLNQRDNYEEELAQLTPQTEQERSK